MTRKQYEVQVGVLIDVDTRVTLSQLCHLCGVQAEYVLELVDEGLIQPAGADISQWHFSILSLQRTRKARRLQADLGINLAGVAVILQLLDEVDLLRLRLKDLQQ